MKRPLLALAVVVFALPATAFGAPKGTLQAPLVPRELSSLAAHPYALLQLERGADASAVRAAGGVLVSDALRIWQLPSADARRLAPRLATAGALADVHPDYPRAPLDHLTASDPLLPEQWWLARVGADQLEPPGPGVPVTIIDSGLNLEHEEFAGRPDTELLNAQSFAQRDEWHGTGVASVIAAPANGLGVVGLYPQAVLRSWDASPPPRGRLLSSEVIRGLDAAAARGRGVVNLSFGGYQAAPLEDRAIVRAVQAGVLVVAAAGNDGDRGNPPTYPALSPHVLTVGASDQNDAVWALSTRSRGVDLAAPGVSMPLAAPGFPEAYVDADGTSFAAPIVAAAAAWVWTLRPELDRTQLFELLRTTARDIDAAGRDLGAGFGILDLPVALTAPAPAPDPLEPNDDIEQVKAKAMFARAKAPLTTPARGTASVTARLDRVSDPEDVYRVWVPAGRKLTLTLTSVKDVDLELWGPNARSVLATGAQRRATLLGRGAKIGAPAREVVTWTNRGKAGAFVYADVFLGRSRTVTETGYLLRIATARAPR